MGFDKQSEIKHPLARSERLLIQNIGDETVIYDEDSKTAHALKPLAATVFMYADGKNTAAEIAELAGYRLARSVTESEVKQAIAELDSCALLDTPGGLLERGISRRDALKTFAAAGAGTMLVSSVAAPFASAAGTNYGASYACGTNTTTGITATDGGSLPNGSGGTVSSWPSPWSVEGGISYSGGSVSTSGTWTWAAPYTAGGPTSSPGTYNFGAGCYVTAPTASSQYCEYDGVALPTTGADAVSQTNCVTNGFYWAGGAWLGNAASKTTDACVLDFNGTYSVISTTDVGGSTGQKQCETNGFYVTSAGAWQSNASSTPSGAAASGICVVGSTTYTGVPSAAACDGFYISGSTYSDETITNVGTAPTSGNNVCVYEYGGVYYSDAASAITSSNCKTTGICVYESTGSGHEKGQAVVKGSSCPVGTAAPSSASWDKYETGTWYPYETGTWTPPVLGAWEPAGYTGGIEGIYQCVPCDGDVSSTTSYQCCEPACVPTGITIGTAVTSGPISATMGPGGVYTESACQIWGNSLCSGYPAKWCTTNPCNSSGDCQHQTYSGY